MRAHKVMGAVFFLAVLPTIGTAQQKVATEAIELHYVDVPTTLKHAILRADAVVRARIGGAQVRTRMWPGASLPDVWTIYTLDMVEVLKQEPTLPHPTEVLRHGGEVITGRGTRRVVEKGFPPFQQGREYLLFLFWNEVVGTYETAFGPDAAFQIGPDNRVRAIGRGLLAQAYDSQDLSEIRKRIREIAAAARKQ